MISKKNKLKLIRNKNKKKYYYNYIDFELAISRAEIRKSKGKVYSVDEFEKFFVDLNSSN